ncbi:MAG: tetratricopeptide repeat protein [Anaerolineae bacterium]|nr:tetratricopeptide repeat protein [Anaerolineae bacterium]
MSPVFRRALRVFLLSFIIFTLLSSLSRVSPVLALVMFIIVIVLPMVYVYVVYQHGAILMMRGQLKDAADHFERVLKLPIPVNRAFLWSRLAALRHASGDTQAAIDAYTEALKLVPGDQSIYAVRSALYIAERDYVSALDDADRLLQINPDSEVGYGNRANANIYLGNYDQAIEDCNRGLALKNSPVGEVLLYNNRGTAQRMKGNYTTALSDYNMALSITIPDPNKRMVHPSVHTNQGIVYVLQGQYDQARAFFNMALKLQPEFARAQAAMATMDYLLGDVEKADVTWQRLIKKDATLYGDIDRALRELQFPSAMADAVRQMLTDAQPA